MLFCVDLQVKKRWWFKFPCADTKINEANWSFLSFPFFSFFIATQPLTTRTLNSYPLITCISVHVHSWASVRVCVHAFMCSGQHRQVCKQERREWARENMIIFVWVNELLTRVTKSLTAKAWLALLVYVWYVQYVQMGLRMWYVYDVY